MGAGTPAANNHASAASVKRASATPFHKKNEACWERSETIADKIGARNAAPTYANTFWRKNSTRIEITTTASRNPIPQLNMNCLTEVGLAGPRLIKNSSPTGHSHHARCV